MATQTPDTTITYSAKTACENSPDFAQAHFVRYYEKTAPTTAFTHVEMHDLISDYIMLRYASPHMITRAQTLEQVDAKWREMVPELNKLLDTFFTK